MAGRVNARSRNCPVEEKPVDELRQGTVNGGAVQLGEYCPGTVLESLKSNKNSDFTAFHENFYNFSFY